MPLIVFAATRRGRVVNGRVNSRAGGFNLGQQLRDACQKMDRSKHIETSLLTEHLRSTPLVRFHPPTGRAKHSLLTRSRPSSTTSSTP